MNWFALNLNGKAAVQEYRAEHCAPDEGEPFLLARANLLQWDCVPKQVDLPRVLRVHTSHSYLTSVRFQ